MRTYFARQFMVEARRQHLLKEHFEQLRGEAAQQPRLWRFATKELKHKSFMAVGTSHKQDGKELFVWLRLLHRNSRDWRYLVGDSRDFWLKVAEPQMEGEVESIRMSLNSAGGSNVLPSLPPEYRPWFQPLGLSPRQVNGGVWFFQAAPWERSVQELGAGGLAALYEPLSELSQYREQALGRADGFEHLRVYRRADLQLLVGQGTSWGERAWILAFAHRGGLAPTPADLPPKLREELLGLDRDLAKGPLEGNDLARRTRCAWPSLLLAEDVDKWTAIMRTQGANLSLSEEELELLDRLTGAAKHMTGGLPLFLQGRAGSGKSTLLTQVFARYLARAQEHDWPGQILLLTHSERLANALREVCQLLLKYSAELRLMVDQRVIENPKFLERQVRPVKGLLLELLDRAGAEPGRRFSDKGYVGFARFKSLFRERQGSSPSEDRSLWLRNRPQGVSPELAWFIIRALIKGHDEDQWMDPDAFAKKSAKTDYGISQRQFQTVYDRVFQPWYRRLCEEGRLWDDQDLARAALREVGELPSCGFIACDEAQDLTPVQLRLFLRLSIASQYPPPPGFHIHLPLLMAGDPLQSVHPSGFRPRDLKRLFDAEIPAGGYGKLTTEELKFNYRSGARIVRFLNLVHAWRARVLGEAEGEDLRPQEPWLVDEGYPPKLIEVSSPDHLPALAPLLKDTLIVVNAEDGGEKEAVQRDPLLSLLKQEPDGVPRNVLSPASIKGMEAPRVVVYRFGEQAPKGLFDAPVAGEEEREDRFEVRHFWNKLYVALSRPREHLYVIDTKDGVERLWAHMLGEEAGGRVPHDSDKAASTWPTATLGYLGRAEHDELALLKEENPQQVASDLEKAGKESQNATLLRKAQGYYQALGDEQHAQRCDAEALELEGRLEDAADRWLRLDESVRAADLLWQAHAYERLTATMTAYPRTRREDRALVSAYLRQSPAAASTAPILKVMQDLSDYLARGVAPPRFEPQWEALGRRLSQDRARQWSHLGSEERRRLSAILADMAQRGFPPAHVLGEAAADAHFDLEEFPRAVEIFEYHGLRDRRRYWLAKAEVSQPPERWGWWAKAGERQRVLEAWRGQPRYDESIRETILHLLKEEARWEEVIRAAMRFPRGLGDATSLYLEHEGELGKETSRLAKDLLARLARAGLWDEAGRLLTEAHGAGTKVSPVEGPPALALEMLGILTKSKEVGRNDLFGRRAGDWLDRILREIDREPGSWARALGIGVLGRLVDRFAAEEGEGDRMLRRLASHADKDLAKSARDEIDRRSGVSQDGREAPARPADASGKREGAEASVGPSPAAGTSRREAIQAVEVITKRKAGERSPTSSEVSTSPPLEEPSTPREEPIDLGVLKVRAIEQLRLKGFRAYDDACLRLEDLTILVGRNGAGKSTLRDALDLLSEALRGSLSSEMEQRGGLSGCLRQSGATPAERLRLGAQLCLDAGERQIRAVYGFELRGREDGDFQVSEERLSFSDDRLPGFVRVGANFEPGLQMPMPSVARDRLLLPQIGSQHVAWSAVYAALASMRSYQLNPSALRMPALARDESILAPDGSNAANVLKHLNSLHPQNYQLVERFLGAVVAGLVKVDSSNLGGYRLLHFTQEAGQKVVFKPHQVSEGTLRTLCVLLALFQRPSPAVVFIDEIEDSLHPGALEAVMSAVESALESSQVVLTSHSPPALMVSQATRARTRVIQWRGGISEIYSLLPPLDGEELAFTVGELLQHNGLPEADGPDRTQVDFFAVEEPK